MRLLHYILESHRQSVDRIMILIATSAMAFFYRRFRLSPEIFMDLCNVGAMATMIISGAYDMASAISNRSVSGIVIALFTIAACTLVGMLYQFKMSKTPKEWSAQRYKMVCLRAVQERESGIFLRLMQFLILVLAVSSFAHHVLVWREINGSLFVVIFFVFLNLHVAALAAEPPPPDDGDAFLAVPQGA